MEYLEWADAEKTKRIEVVEEKHQDVLDLRHKDYAEAQQGVSECEDKYITCLARSLSGLATFV
jgi:hypothetical protein